MLALRDEYNLNKQRKGISMVRTYTSQARRWQGKLRVEYGY